MDVKRGHWHRGMGKGWRLLKCVLEENEGNNLHGKVNEVEAFKHVWWLENTPEPTY